MNEHLDERDAKLFEVRQAFVSSREEPSVGDFVEFADGVLRRISYAWPDSVQTSQGGQWYLGETYVSFSGSLHPPVPIDTHVATGDRRNGRSWIFHHNDWRADNNVDVDVSFPVWRCSLEAPK